MIIMEGAQLEFMQDGCQQRDFAENISKKDSRKDLCFSRENSKNNVFVIEGKSAPGDFDKLK